MLSLFNLMLLVTATYGQFVFQPGPLIPQSNGEIWPQPQKEYREGTKYFNINPLLFYFHNVGKTCATLNEALWRYKTIITSQNRYIKKIYYPIRICDLDNDASFLGTIFSLEVELTKPCNDKEYPTIEMKEEYTLNVTQTKRRLTSDTLWGILRGLETFSQLMYLSDDYSCHKLRSTSIHDFPRLRHRGMLLDTSRHYQSEDEILKMLDTMSYNKYNVFHWHITDDYSFPFVSTTFPQLSKKGAFHPSLMVYRPDFVQEVMEYARKRGIRVMVEFDTPGHTLSWGLGNPDLLTKCNNVPLLEWGPIDPTKNSTYEFIFKFFDEVKAVFKDKYTHLGGDEVDFACWQSNAAINEFMANNGMAGNYVALQSYYTKKLIDYIDSLGLHSIVWEEVFTNGVQLPNSTIINAWKLDNPKGVLQNITAAGHPVIVSNYWYLSTVADQGDWVRFYNVDPQDFNGTPEQKALVIGAEASMWGEVVNENNLQSRMWPRGSVPAEKFWSAPGPFITGLFEIFSVGARLQEQTCRMNRRGIRAQPPTGPSVCF